MRHKTWAELYADTVSCREDIEMLARDIQRKTHDKDIEPDLKRAFFSLDRMCIRLNTRKIREKAIGR